MNEIAPDPFTGAVLKDAAGAAGFVKATVGGVTGQARLRVIPPLPWTYDFENDKAVPAWWTSNGKVKLDPAMPGAAAQPVDRLVRFASGLPLAAVLAHIAALAERARSQRAMFSPSFAIAAWTS